MPHIVDVEIGRRVREARLAKDMTQTDLGDAIGITFQQIQKYEKGKNRISGSRLWMIAKVLDVPMLYFFDGLEGKKVSEEKLEAQFAAILPEGTIRVAKMLHEMPEGDLKRQLFRLIKAFRKAG